MTDAEILLTNIYSLGEHAVWQDCFEHVKSGLQTWLRTANVSNFQRIYIVGCGTSYYAAQVGKYVIEHLTHLPVEAQQAFVFSIYTNPALMDEKTLVIGISTTGNTESVCNAIEFARRHGAADTVFYFGSGLKNHGNLPGNHSDRRKGHDSGQDRDLLTVLDLPLPVWHSYGRSAWLAEPRGS